MSIDAHCHIDLHTDPKAAMESAISARVQVVAVTTTPAAFKVSSTFTNTERGIFPALGMHPEVVGSRPQDMALFSRYLDQVAWVGEVGLDGSRRFHSSWDAQVAVFERVLQECSAAGGRILSVHSRSATSKVFDLLSQYPGAGTTVFHWFSGRSSEVAEAIRLGGYFSVNQEMMQSAAGKTIVRRIPMDRLLTESDAPFAKTRGPVDIAGQVRTAELQLAEIFGYQLEGVVAAIDENFRRLTAATTT